MSAADSNAQMGQAPITKNMIGATYENPYQAPYADSDYTQNAPPPNVQGGGLPFVNPQSVVDQQFFNPTTPNDPAFSDDQPPANISSANPIGQIMSDFQQAIDRQQRS